MPRLAAAFAAACDTACRLAAAGEQVRVLGGTIARQHVTIARLEYLYEIAYLRIFIAWEDFLEESFLRYMCGFRNSTGPIPRAGGAAYCASISAAKTLLYSGAQFMLWHNAPRVVTRSQTHFVQGLHETVLASSQTRLEWFSNVRHRVAHGQTDAQHKFDAATMQLVGRRYPASRVGRFLRDVDQNQNAPLRWLESIANELSALASQVVP
jgi:hypothetical protein